MDKNMFEPKSLDQTNPGHHRSNPKLQQAQQGLETEVAAAPEPVTESRVRQMIVEYTPKPSEKYARCNLMAGPTSPDGNLTAGAQGQVFLPFAGHHALQAQGDFMRNFRRNEGQFDIALGRTTNDRVAQSTSG